MTLSTKAKAEREAKKNQQLSRRDWFRHLVTQYVTAQFIAEVRPGAALEDLNDSEQNLLALVLQTPEFEQLVDRAASGEDFAVSLSPTTPPFSVTHTQDPAPTSPLHAAGFKNMKNEGE